jgi:hypothetical protein
MNYLLPLNPYVLAIHVMFLHQPNSRGVKCANHSGLAAQNMNCLRTLGSCVRIPPKRCIFVCLLSVVVVLCIVGSGLATG